MSCLGKIDERAAVPVRLPIIGQTIGQAVSSQLDEGQSDAGQQPTRTVVQPDGTSISYFGNAAPSPYAQIAGVDGQAASRVNDPNSITVTARRLDFWGDLLSGKWGNVVQDVSAGFQNVMESLTAQYAAQDYGNYFNMPVTFQPGNGVKSLADLRQQQAHVAQVGSQILAHDPLMNVITIGALAPAALIVAPEEAVGALAIRAASLIDGAGTAVLKFAVNNPAAVGAAGFVSRLVNGAFSGSGDGVPQPAPAPAAAESGAFATTEGVAVSGSRAIDLGASYETGIQGLYPGTSLEAQRFTAIVNGEPVSGVADAVAEINGQNTAIEAKFVDNWATSLRNPNSPIGQTPFAIQEQQAVVNQAANYSAAFEGGVVYHTNSVEFANYYSNAFTNAGITNFKFVITPSIR